MEFPLHEGDIRLVYPEIPEEQTGDTFPCPEGYVVVKQGDIPTFDSEKQKIYFSPPIEVKGEWVMQWSIVDLTQEELDAIAQTKIDMLPLVLKKKGNVPNVV